MTAVRTVQKPCEHLHFTRLGRAVLCVHDLVYRVPQFLRNDWLMAVFHHNPILSRTLHHLLAFHGLRSLLAVDQPAEIDFIVQNHPDRCDVPVEFLPPVIGFEVVGIVLIEVSDGVQHLFFSENSRDLVVPDALRSQPENASDNLCRRLIHNQVVAVIRIQLVAERRLGTHELPSLCFGFLGGFGLF